MGSSKKLKLRGQPKKIFTDGGGAQGGINDYDDSLIHEEKMIDEILIELIHLNPDVLEKATSGYKVTVKQSSNGLGVDVKAGRIGYVPHHYKAIVKQNSLFVGTIVEIGKKPISASVRLSNREK